MYRQRYGDNRFWAPFLLGGLLGAGVTSVSRPRPVYINPYYNPYYRPYYNGPFYY